MKKILITRRLLKSCEEKASKIFQVNDFPRTRSGKISELAVKDIIHGKEIKNTEALINPEILNIFRDFSDLFEK